MPEKTLRNYNRFFISLITQYISLIDTWKSSTGIDRSHYLGILQKYEEEMRDLNRMFEGGFEPYSKEEILSANDYKKLSSLVNPL